MNAMHVNAILASLCMCSFSVSEFLLHAERPTEYFMKRSRGRLKKQPE